MNKFLRYNEEKYLSEICTNIFDGIVVYVDKDGNVQLLYIWDGEYRDAA
jgi:hypothetical protein